MRFSGRLSSEAMKEHAKDPTVILLKEEKLARANN